MDIATLRKYLDEPVEAEGWLRSLGVIDLSRAHGNLLSMATSTLTLDLLAVMCRQMERALPGCPDPDMAINGLERFVSASLNSLSLGTLFERDNRALPILVQIMSNSQYLTDLLITDPESFDILRITEGQPLARKRMVEDLSAEVTALDDGDAVLSALRRFKRREILRISYGDIIREQTLRVVTGQISHLADAILEAALIQAWRKVTGRRGAPRGDGGQRAKFTVIAMGKLGGTELNYSSDIDLIFLYDVDGSTDGRRRISNSEFFQELARELVRLVTESTELGNPYRVDLRLRPDGKRGPMVISLAAARQYYDLRGRTWERQAFIKARAVAGDIDLGEKFLGGLKSWVYQRYLNSADISGIRALKRRIERRTRQEGGDIRNVKTGRGGIRDVEFVIQFLQLLNGGTLPAVQTGNTLEAISQLGNVGCLSDQERNLLQQNYVFLRKIEHRLQIMFDLQTHLLPDNKDELRKLSLRMGYVDGQHSTALAQFEKDYRRRTALNRKILDHLLHDAFSDDVETEAEVDLVLDPDPPEERIVEVLGKYQFRDIMLAYRNLMMLSVENIRFLSTRRCRHFLAAIAPELLAAVADTPDPDSTLVNLDKVSNSLGGKGVLWELFSFNSPSLKLYVELCAYSPYLCDILIGNPGMIDGLMDSLSLDKLPSREFLIRILPDLCRAAEDIDPILQSFKNAQLLRVGTRDILGKEDIKSTTASLSDIAESCLVEIAKSQYEQLVPKYGRPTIGEGPNKGAACDVAIVALGKFGGREMNYLSDLDLMFLYAADGNTVREKPDDADRTTTNQHFYSEWGQRVISAASRMSAYGRLYEVDVRLRPTGKSGMLATSLAGFGKYFADGDGQLWERLALCKARVVFGPKRMIEAVNATLHKAAFGKHWEKRNVDAIREMRRRLEEATTLGDIKRSTGGIVDIEFIVQALQLKYAESDGSLRIPNTLTALTSLHKAGHLNDDDWQFLSEAYRSLRTLESRLRLINVTGRDSLPKDPTKLAKLAHLLRYSSGEAVLDTYQHISTQVRERYDRILGEIEKNNAE